MALLAVGEPGRLDHRLRHRVQHRRGIARLVRIDRDHHIAVHELLLAYQGVSGEEGNATSGRTDLS
jgi:hypothetical protein